MADTQFLSKNSIEKVLYDQNDYPEGKTNYPLLPGVKTLYLLHFLFRKFGESFSTFGQLRLTLAEIDRIL